RNYFIERIWLPNNTKYVAFKLLHLTAPLFDGIVRSRPEPSASSTSMRWPRHRAAALADEEVEIAAEMRLLHMLLIELYPAAIGMRLRRRPVRAPLSELLLAHFQ